MADVLTGLPVQFRAQVKVVEGTYEGKGYCNLVAPFQGGIMKMKVPDNKQSEVKALDGQTCTVVAIATPGKDNKWFFDYHKGQMEQAAK